MKAAGVYGSRLRPRQKKDKYTEDTSPDSRTRPERKDSEEFEPGQHKRKKISNTEERRVNSTPVQQAMPMAPNPNQLLMTQQSLMYNQMPNMFMGGQMFQNPFQMQLQPMM